MARILALAALPEEADALFPALGERSTVAGLPLRSLSVHGHALSITTIGIGKVNAAAAAALLAERLQPGLIIVSGTCGRLDSAVTGACFWVRDAVQHDYGARLTDGFHVYPAGDMPFGAARDAPFVAIDDPGTGLPHARIASGDSFVGCPDAARAVAANTGAQIVDMEVAAIAQVAALLSLPWAAVKAPSDDADGDGADHFADNLRAAARRAGQGAEHLLSLLPR